MTKSDLADAHRALLEGFLSEVERAIKHREDEIFRICEMTGEGITAPPLQLYQCSPDTLKIVTEGLRAALDGHPDPFGLKTGSNYSKSRSKRVRSETLAKILKLNRSGVSLDEACAKCAPNGVSGETVKGWLKNKTERVWIEQTLDIYERRKREARALLEDIQKNKER